MNKVKESLRVIFLTNLVLAHTGYLHIQDICTPGYLHILYSFSLLWQNVWLRLRGKGFTVAHSLEDTVPLGGESMCGSDLHSRI